MPFIARLALLPLLSISSLIDAPARAGDLDGWTVETSVDDVPDHPIAHPPAETARRHGSRLTLREAVSRALANHPSIKAAFEEIHARGGEEFQASRKANPELLLEVENFGGTKDKQGFDAAEETVSLTQLVELGGKRILRIEAARLDTSLATWDFEAVRVQVATQTAQAFVDVLIAQERAKLLKEFVTAARKTRDSVSARVDAGKASPIELNRADVALARAKAQVSVGHTRLGTARRKLAAQWRGNENDVASVAGRFGNGANVPTAEQLQAYLDSNPSLARWGDEVSRRAAQVDIETAKAVPDITVGAGVRHYNENDSSALVASLSLPLPIFDRNQGNFAAAERRLAKSHAEAEAHRGELQRALIDAAGDLHAAATELTALKRDVLPVAQSAYDRTKIGFDEGKFDLLNVLDVQRSVFEVRLDILNARAAYEQARVKVEALVGRDINEFQERRMK